MNGCKRDRKFLLLEWIELNSWEIFFSSKLISLTVVSLDPVAIYYPSNENATLSIASKNKLNY